MYAIVSFDDTDETDFVPVNWMEVDKVVKVYWPPWRNSTTISRAKKQCSDAESGWPVYDARILSTAGMYIKTKLLTVHLSMQAYKPKP